MTDTALLRQLTRADLEGIWRVRYAVRENVLTPGRISDADVIEYMEVTGRGWCIEVNGELVGFAIGSAVDGKIWALFVHPDHAGRGYGRRLHDEMIAWLWARGLQRLWLTTQAGSHAETFYRLSGWIASGRTEQGELRFELPRPPHFNASKDKT